MASGGVTRQQNATQPWRGQAPYLRDLYSQAQNWAGQGAYEYGPI